MVSYNIYFFIFIIIINYLILTITSPSALVTNIQTIESKNIANNYKLIEIYFGLLSFRLNFWKTWFLFF